MSQSQEVQNAITIVDIAIEEHCSHIPATEEAWALIVAELERLERIRKECIL